MLRSLPLAVLALLLSAGLSGQNLAAPVLSGSWQSTYHNPAMVHFLPTKVTLGLPGIANDLRLQNLKAGDLFVKRDGQRILNLENWSLRAQEDNQVQDVYSIETIGLAVREGRFGFSAYHRLRAFGEAEYSKSLVDLIALGNANFLGRPADIAPRGKLVSFQELGLSLSYAVSEKVAVGGRVKYLAGVSNIQTVDGGTLKLTTGVENYTLTLEQDLSLQTVGALTYENLDSLEVYYNPSRLHPSDLFTANRGVAVDLGIAVNLDRLRLNASATDLAAGIDWKEDVTNLRFSGTRSFSGIDILGDLLRDSVSLQEATDSLVLRFSPTETNADYRTELAPTFYLGAEYDITDKFTLGGLVVLENRLGEAVPALVVSGRYDLLPWLSLGASLNHRPDLRTNVGLNLYATPGRLQFFLSSDKFFTLLTTGNSSVSGLRLGFAVELGSPRRSSSSFLP